MTKAAEKFKNREGKNSCNFDIWYHVDDIQLIQAIIFTQIAQTHRQQFVTPYTCFDTDVEFPLADFLNLCKLKLLDSEQQYFPFIFKPEAGSAHYMAGIFRKERKDNQNTITLIFFDPLGNTRHDVRLKLNEIAEELDIKLIDSHHCIQTIEKDGGNPVSCGPICVAFIQYALEHPEWINNVDSTFSLPKPLQALLDDNGQDYKLLIMQLRQSHHALLDSFSDEDFDNFQASHSELNNIIFEKATKLFQKKVEEAKKEQEEDEEEKEDDENRDDEDIFTNMKESKPELDLLIEMKKREEKLGITHGILVPKTLTTQSFDNSSPQVKSKNLLNKPLLTEGLRKIKLKLNFYDTSGDYELALQLQLEEEGKELTELFFQRLSFLNSSFTLVSKDFSNLQPLSQNSSLVEVDTPHDGSCLFYAVVLSVFLPILETEQFNQRFTQLFGSEDPLLINKIKELLKNYNGNITSLEKSTLTTLINDQLRPNVSIYMLDNMSYFLPFFESDGQKFYRHLWEITQSGGWGDQYEIVALSRMLSININPYQTNNGNLSKDPVDSSFISEDSPTISLVFTSANSKKNNRRNHYHYLIDSSCIPKIVLPSSSNKNDSSLISNTKIIKKEDQSSLKEKWQLIRSDKNQINANAKRRLESNLVKINKLKFIIQEIQQASGQHTSSIGASNAGNYQQKFPDLFTDMTALNSTALKNQIGKLSWEEYQRRLVIYFFQILMSIPYKQGRNNLSKSPFENLSHYLTNCGLASLVQDLKNIPLVLPKDFKIIIEEIIQEMPIILEFFHLNQLKEPGSDSGSELNNLIQHQIELTNRIQGALINETKEFMEGLVEKGMLSVEAIKRKKPSKPTEETQLQQQINLAERLIAKIEKKELIQGHISLHQLKDYVVILRSILKQKNTIQEIQSQKRVLKNQKDNWEKHLSSYELYEKKDQKIKKINLDKREKNTIELLEKERDAYKILTEEEIEQKKASLTEK